MAKSKELNLIVESCSNLMQGEEGDSDRVRQWAGAGAVPGPDQLHAQQAQQVSWGQGQHP